MYTFVLTLGLVLVASGIIVAVRGRTAISIALGSATIWLGIVIASLVDPFPYLPPEAWALALACFWAFRTAALSIGTLRRDADRSLSIVVLAIGGVVLGVALCAMFVYSVYWSFYVSE